METDAKFEHGTGDDKKMANGEVKGHESDVSGEETPTVKVLDRKSKEEAMKILQNADIMAQLEKDETVTHIGMLAELPPSVRRRVKALKKLQLATCKVEEAFYREMHAIECKFAPQFKVLMDARKTVVIGTHEPTDEECDFTLDDEALAEELKQKAAINGDIKMEEPDDVKGIPDFWLTIFRNVDLLSDMVQEQDESVLKHLVDIEAKLDSEPMGFTLTFTFTPNEFFSNGSLTKYYKMKCEVEDNTPFEFDGPEIVDCKGCTIDWKPGKDVTKKLIKKKQKHKQRGSTRFVTKEVKADSFFNFFDPPPMPKDDDEDKDDDREILSADFEIGQVLRDQIIPRAVLYFTGEVNDDESFDDEDDEDDDLEDEDESESGEDDEGKAVRQEK